MKSPDKFDVSRHFVLVLAVVALLTFTFFIVATIVAVWGGEGGLTKEIVSGCLTMSKIGFGAIVGLLGGKTV